MHVDDSAAENVCLLSELERDSNAVSQCQWRFLIGRGQIGRGQLETLRDTLTTVDRAGRNTGEGKQTQMLGLG